MKRAAPWRVLAALACCGLAGGAAAASSPIESGLAGCAAVGAAQARLACYDDLARRLGGPGSPPAAGPAAAPAAPAAARSAAAGAGAAASGAPAPATPAQHAAPAAAAAAAAPATPDPEADTRNFGLSAAQLHTIDERPKSIQAHVEKVFFNANRRGYIVLDNGQTWVATDDEPLLNDGEAVTVSRGAMGSFMLHSSVSKRSFHVRRIR